MSKDLSLRGIASRNIMTAKPIERTMTVKEKIAHILKTEDMTLAEFEAKSTEWKKAKKDALAKVKVAAHATTIHGGKDVRTNSALNAGVTVIQTLTNLTQLPKVKDRLKELADDLTSVCEAIYDEQMAIAKKNELQIVDVKASKGAPKAAPMALADPDEDEAEAVA
jgi:hypothetical protein